MVRSRPGLPFLALVFALTIIVASVVSAAPARPVVAQAPTWLDTSNRQAVVNAFNTEFGRAATAIGWTGSSANCNAGSTDPAHRQTVITRVNYFRAMAGVPAQVTENASMSAAAQQMALMISRSGQLSHHPDTSYTCFTQTGAETAAKSNLYLGMNGVSAINGYMRDESIDDVGHRVVLLHPPTQQMGTGDVPETASTHPANTLFAFDDRALNPAVPTRESQGFVAWPPRGYVPPQLVYPMWSVSVEGGDFTNSSVEASVGGQSLPVRIEHRGRGTGAPFPTLTWSIDGLPEVPVNDVTVNIAVTGTRADNTVKTFEYAVTILGQGNTTAIGDSHRAFVDQAYWDFVGRPANAAELDHWSSQLGSGLSRYTFVRHLAASPSWTSFVVNQLYLETLGRPADEAGRSYWAARLQTGTPVATVAAAFYGSPEYVARHGSTFEPWITDLYRVLLNRTADTDGLEYWSGLATAEGSGVVAYRLYQSPESRASRVRSMYQRFLGRQPDAAGLAFWTDALSSGNDLDLAANLASSDEYLVRDSR